MKGLVLDNLRRDQLTDAISKGRRLDGRGMSEYRKLEIRPGIIPKAEGSARVKLGDTEVMAGVKIEHGKPFPDTPDQGVLIINAEVLPLASEYAEPGPPDEDAIELARVVDRGIRESKMVDVNKLVIVPGKEVYLMYVDISVISSGGNLFDASSYAVVAALMNTKFKILKQEENGSVTPTDEMSELPIVDLPVSITAVKIKKGIILDPDVEEESINDGRLTIAYDQEGNLCAIQKGQASGLKVEEIMEIVKMGKEKVPEIREMIRGALEKNG